MSYTHPLAAIELEDAALYYAQISPALAEKFLNDFEQTLSFIEAMPGVWAFHYSDLRKLNFKTFPYFYNLLLACRWRRVNHSCHSAPKQKAVLLERQNLKLSILRNE